MIFCTLFDSNYLDKGIALVNSLNRTTEMFTLYIYAFDKKAYDVLVDLGLCNVKPILFESIITDELIRIREERSRAEFCWTCTPFVVEYTLINFKEAECTYIDADLYFYSDPKVLIQEMYNQDCSVQMVEHRFPNYVSYRRTEKMSGKYCVEFNTFLNNKEGLDVLRGWKQQCIECCTSDWKQGNFGDQKYLDTWLYTYNGINVLNNHGGGVAPWNVCRYIFIGQGNSSKLMFQEKKTKEIYSLVFYHFHGLHFINDTKIKINVYNRVGKHDCQLIDKIYYPYITELIDIRKMLLEKYQIKLSVLGEKKTFLWNKKDKLSVQRKLSLLLYLPLTVYQNVICDRADIIEIRMEK